MGYFDAIAVSAFDVDPQNRRVFFPWGFLARGYVVPTETDYERLRKTLIGASKLTLLLISA